MNIFDAHISGSLSVSASAEISNNLLVSGNLSVLGSITGSISGNITNSDTASFAPKYTLTSSFNAFTSSHNTGSFTGSFKGDGLNLYNIPASGITGLNLSQIAQGSVTASISSTNGLRVNTKTEITGSLIATGQVSGSFMGDGTGLYNIPASGVTGLNLTQIADGVATASISNTNGLRINTKAEITGALTISGSITLNGVPVGTGKLDETTFNTYTSSNDSTNSTQNSRLTSIESTTSSLNTFSSSINTTIKSKLNTESVVSGSAQIFITGTTGYSTFSSSISTSIGALSSSITSTINSLSSSISSSVGSISGSIATTTLGLNTSITDTSSSISTSIGNLSSSISAINNTQNSKLNSIESTTSSLNTFSSSIDTTIKNKLNTESVISGSVQVSITGTTGYSTFSSSVSTSIGNLSSSVATTTSGLSSTITSLSSSITSSVGSLSSSVNTTINNLSSSVATTTNNLSSSVTSTINSLSSSIATTDLDLGNRLTTIESRYATTGSNTFVGNQTITGSLVITQNLQVYGSSSITYVTASQIAVSSSVISINVFEPAERFGGLKIYDSGSSSATASFLWDSLNNRFIYQNVDGASYHGGMFIAGPRNTGSLGEEVGLTSNKIAKSAGGDHLNDSNITDTGTLVTINSNTDVTGTLKVTGTITGTLSGNASTATSASYSSTATSSSYANNATSSSYSSTATSSSYASNATSSSYSSTATSSSYASTATSSSYASNSTNALTASYVAGANVSGNISGTSSNITATSNTSLTSLSNLNTVGTITGGTWNGTAIANSYLANPSFYVGTTSISLGRASSSQTLTGVSIDGNAATVTGGVYTSGDQTIAGVKTFSSNIINSATADWYMYGFGARGASSGGYGMGLKADITDRTLSFHVPNIAAYSNTGATPKFGWYSNGAVELMTLQSATGNLVVTGTINGLTVSSGTISSGTWNGTAIGDSYISSATNWNTAYNKRISTLGFTSSTVTITLADTTTVTASVPTLNQNTTGTAANITASSNTSLTSLANLATVGTITTGVWNGSTIGNAYLTNSSFYIGTTSISLGRGSASQTLTGVGVDGNAGTATTLATARTLTVGGTGKSFNGSADVSWSLSEIGALSSGIAQQGGVSYVTHDFNSYPAVYNVTFINPSGSSNLPTNMTSVMSYRFIMAGGDTTSRGVDLVVAAENSGNMYMRERSIGTWSRMLHSNNYTTYAAPSTGSTSITTLGTIVTGTWNGSSIGTAYTAAKVTAVNAGTGVSVDTTTGSVTVSIGQAVATSSNVTFARVTTPKIAFERNANAAHGISWYNISTYTSWCDYMSNGGATSTGPSGNITASTGTYVTSWARRFFVEDSSTYGWIFEKGTVSGQPSVVAELRSSDGLFSTAGAIYSAGSLVKTSANSSYSTTFSSVTSVTVTHNLGTKDVAVFVYDSSDNMFWPSSIVTTSTSVVTVTFASSRSGRVVVVR